MNNTENYRAIPLSSVPDCCGVCAYGDHDGEGCDVLIDNDFGITEKQLNTGFNYFFVCDRFERTRGIIIPDGKMSSKPENSNYTK